jgi:hypothetical protein
MFYGILFKMFGSQKSFAMYQIARRLGIVALVCIAPFLKFSFIIGSEWAFFGANCIFMPLAGLIGGASGTFIYFISKLLLTKTLYTGGFLSKGLLFVVLRAVPGLFASSSWYLHRFVNLFVIALCTVLFVMHSVGVAAWIYAGYWLIPAIIIITRQQSIFLRALSATFIAHAVGSVVWLYTGLMVPQHFLALIPVVFFERLFFAAAITALYLVYQQCLIKLKVTQPSRVADDTKARA